MQKIFLITFLSLSVVACNELPKFPNITKWMLDFPNNKTTGFYLKDPVHMIYIEAETKDIQSTNGMFCMSASDETKIAKWINDVRVKYEQLKNCQCPGVNGN